MAPRCHVKYLALVLTMAASPAIAALPPAYQRAAELKAVTDAATESLEGDPVVSVEYILEDVYRAHSDKCTVTVVINTVIEEATTPAPGPRKFEAVADDPVCEPE